MRDYKNRLRRTNICVGQMVYNVTEEECVIEGITLLKMENNQSLETPVSKNTERYVVKEEWEHNGNSTDVIIFIKK